MKLISEFPKYIKHYDYYMFIDAQTYIEVMTEPCSCELLGIRHMKSDFIAERVQRLGDPITENQFIDAYVKAFHAIQELVNPSEILMDLQKAS